jgi:hypothetical protein
MNPDLKPEFHKILFLYKRILKLARSCVCCINKGHIQDIEGTDRPD